MLLLRLLQQAQLLLDRLERRLALLHDVRVLGSLQLALELLPTVWCTGTARWTALRALGALRRSGGTGCTGGTTSRSRVRWFEVCGHTHCLATRCTQGVPDACWEKVRQGGRVRGPRTLNLCVVSSPCLAICGQDSSPRESRLKAWCRHSSAQGRRASRDLGGECFNDHVDLGLVVDLALRLGLGSLKGLGGLHGSGLRHRKQAAVYGVGR